MLPFSAQAFFALYESYNAAVWPVAALASGLGLGAFVLLFRPEPWAGRAIGVSLALMWAWTGIVYHGLFFTPLNFAAPLFAALFILQAGLLAWRVAAREDVAFRYEGETGGRAGVALIVLALFAYPGRGLLSGRGAGQAALFGIAPATVVLFTLGVLLMARPRLPGWLAAIPLAWCLIAAATGWVLAIPEQMALALAGLLALAAAKSSRVS